MKNFKIIYALAFLVFASCSSSDDDEVVAGGNEDNTPTKTVFERLQGNAFKQVERQGDCDSCEDEINYYVFTESYVQVVGTELDGTCEQNDKNYIDNCLMGCVTIEEDTTEKMRMSLSPFGIEQTITFLDDDTIQFDFPFAGETWTAELHTGTVPNCPAN